ncbi:hypothetical protein ColTof4_08574 [Colletotrichum tofieldiae]|nr:hypothetical protein ColTof3_04226 [Colletotrichum tofieldiae]GKT76151.1 hypothetical protein ColTof4_08574 [Colletotrichum tofieldiae]GKT87183.1 hypothetical protein Ct61P_05033 [Colletotrichum tofieldiae]
MKRASYTSIRRHLWPRSDPRILSFGLVIALSGELRRRKTSMGAMASTAMLIRRSEFGLT